MAMLERTCETCAASFLTRPIDVAHGEGRFCSRHCADAARTIRRICRQCGASFRGHKSRVYCSEQCRKVVARPAWNKGLTGQPARRPRNGAAKECAHCGAPFYVPASALARRYCSPTCYLAARWGESHRETVACVVCGTMITAGISARRKVCSETCRRHLIGQRNAGELCVFWRGGRVAVYGRDWKLARSTALERDGHKCVLCGATERLSVHHVVPYRHCRHHRIENLVTLCRSCHSRSEIGVNEAVYEALRVLRWPHAQHDESAPVR